MNRTSDSYSGSDWLVGGSDCLAGDNAEPEGPDPLHAIHVRSKFLGRRILALDGGGIRAIIQIKILAAIEEKMGGFLPIERFFDLIGGTSAGTLVAFAISIKDWRFDHTELVFREICERSFSSLAKNWIFQFFWGSQYRAEPLTNTLKEVLGEVGGKYLVQARLRHPSVPFLNPQNLKIVR
jgi:predicted acylesterase/phospholipase RssA